MILPLENTEVSEELNLKPKRGVLLAGPPGTGKTTIGRALARRLKSKFFLIDGTVISGTPAFHQVVHRVFEAAKQNAPAIIFIDDTDVVFEGGHETGFYRYLLTMLDGLESASAGRVCLIMTAMDVGNLPPALARRFSPIAVAISRRRSDASTSRLSPTRARDSRALTSGASSTTASFCSPMRAHAASNFNRRPRISSPRSRRCGRTRSSTPRPRRARALGIRYGRRTSTRSRWDRVPAASPRSWAAKDSRSSRS